MQPYLLGIDIGTGSTKAVAVNFNGAVVGVVQHHYSVKSPQPGYSEQDPAIILTAFKSCITDSVSKYGGPPEAIGLSSAMHSVIAVDVNGNALADMMTWADSRSEAIAQKLRDSPDGPSIYKTTGTPIHAMTPLCKLMWLREHEPQLFGSAFKFISIKEYIWFYLFHEFQIDYSIASATGLFDIKNLVWNPDACSIAGLSAASLAEPVNTTYQRSDLSNRLLTELNLKQATTFIIGASDGCCANLGSFVTDAGVAAITIGTSGAVRITSKQPVYDFKAMIFNYLLDEQTFVCGGAVNNGGIALQWLLKSFLNKALPGHTDYEEAFKEMATVPTGSEGLIFLPFLYGERAPLWDTKSCGVYFNIKPLHTRAHFLRAGLEGICMSLNDVLQTLELSSQTINQVNISGGFITSPFWTQLLADVTGKKLAIVQQDDASAIGAVYLSMRALGLDAGIQQQTENHETFIAPNLDHHQTYKNRFRVYKRLYTDLKDTMHWMHNEENTGN
jgi:gluconokinase